MTSRVKTPLPMRQPVPPALGGRQGLPGWVLQPVGRLPGTGGGYQMASTPLRLTDLPSREDLTPAKECMNPVVRQMKMTGANLQAVLQKNLKKRKRNENITLRTQLNNYLPSK